MTQFFLKLIRALLFRIEKFARVFGIRVGYRVVLERIRHRSRESKIKVLFLTSEIAKWKAQSLYDLLEKSDVYEPVIGLTHFDFDWELSIEEQRDKFNNAKDFFLSQGMRVIEMYDHDKRTAISPATIGADVVFYQMPFAIHHEQNPRAVGIYALTCYIPYYVMNYGNKNSDFGNELHHTVWRYFILNKEYERCYWNWRCIFSYCGRLMGLGHPSLDYYGLHKDELEYTNYVIYAPHWSFSHQKNENCENFSTFLHTAGFMLEYAKKHKSMNWVFRPHPTLRHALLKSGAWSEEQVTNYWSAWQKIGRLSVGGDYQELLLKSRALVTDCGSFLTEYFLIGKPLIHLISMNVKMIPHKISKPYFDTFYKVHTIDELQDTLAMVLERGDDPLKSMREEARLKSGLADNYAALNIIRHFDFFFKINRKE